MSAASARSPSHDPPLPSRQPVMRVNNYDRVSASLIATVMALCVAVVLVIAWWLSTRPPRQDFLRPMEMVVTGQGGVEDGVLGESLKVESPEEAADNPSPVQDAVDSNLVTSAVDVLESSGAASEIAEFGSSQTNRKVAMESGAIGVAGGQPGSSDGTGNRRGLGNGPGPGGGGISAEQRWFITFADDVSLKEYAQQLDFFGIELGALLPTGQLVYLSNVSKPQPLKRTATSGDEEKRLFMTWRGGTRKAADTKLFQAVGVDTAQAVMFHFYSARAEEQLLNLEYQYARRNALMIRRTYFNVVKQGNGFAFVVTRQVPLR